jgi:DNA polymerase I
MPAMKKKRTDSRQPSLFPDFDEATKDLPEMPSPEGGTAMARAGESPPLHLPAQAPLLVDQPPMPRPLGPDDLVILVDSHSLIYQVFHAMPSMTGPNGQEVGAVHGFLRDLADLRDKWQPAYLICAFDESELTFRNELYDQYKAHRDPMPEALRVQMPIIHRAVETLQIVKLSLAGYEADDILATLAAEVEKVGARCLLVTSDKDCRQLLSDHVQMLNIRKSEVFDTNALQLAWGILPEQVVDYQALVGDSVDNVPGVPQIGPKAAQQLLTEFGSLEGVYAALDRVAGAKRQETLRNHRQEAFLSQKLARLRRDVPIEIDWLAWRNRLPDAAEVNELFLELGFRRLSERFAIANSAQSTARHGPIINRSQYRRIVPDETKTFNDRVSENNQPGSEHSIACMDRPICQSLPSFIHEITEHYRTLPEGSRFLAIDTETTSLSARDAEPVGYSIAWSEGAAAYLPILGPASTQLLNHDAVKAFLKGLLEDPSIRKIGQNLKYDLLVLRSQGLSVQGMAMDTMVADYLLEPGGRNHNLDDLAKRHLGHETITISQLIGSGKEQRSMATVDLDLIAVYASEDADVPFRLNTILAPELGRASLMKVFEDIEIPLIEVLAEMEFNGIAVDCERLQELGIGFARKIESLKHEVLTLAGEEFNPDSPKQLATILFEKLGLRVVKKTKTGASTDAEVLQELALEHPLPEKIVAYRQATKLKSTYIDALPLMVSPKTGRIHTSFRQDIAATGRLSSSEPNLQNIPVRTEEGRAIRSAFKPGHDGWVLMTADYSQIELRVLAHYCGDVSLKHAFENDEDIHTRVAAEVHGVTVDEVTSSMRREAKAVNFGILYGQSPFGLAKSLGISKGEAADFIDRYFDRYRSVRDFMRQTLEACRLTGFVMTISGRKRFLKGLRDFGALNPQQQKTLLEPERMAVNTVIQGSAADLIKIAMIRIHRKLREGRLKAKLLLQIHDELIFEAPSEEVPLLAELVRHEMINAVSLDVPLKVDIKTGDNWAACELV